MIFLRRRKLHFRSLVALFFASLVLASTAAEGQTAAPENYRLAAGDAIKVVVFQNPDLTLDTRVSEDGTINYPLVGSIAIGSLEIGAAERKVAKALEDGGFIKKPQVNIQLVEIRGNKVAVLGQVNRAGSFVLQTTNIRVSQLLAEAGGVTAIGDDHVILTGTRGGQPLRREIDMDALFRDQNTGDDPLVAGGDTIYVPRAPMFYIYGEVIKPGNYRVERNMTMRQAIASGGGLTLRGTERRLRVVRPNAQGVPEKVSIGLDDPVLKDDVIYVAESLF